MTEKKKRGRPKKETIELKIPETDQPVLVDIIEATVDKPDLIEIEGVEETSLIAKEIRKFEDQIAEIQDALASIKLSGITEVEDKLKAINSKIVAQLKLPALLSALEDLKNKHKVRIDAVKGNKSFSPLEDGTLDDEDD
jgi:hypothetical protein